MSPHKHQSAVKMASPDEINFFAQTNFRNERTKFGIKTDDRRRHVYIIGKTGMGKTVLLENMIIQDIANGNGCAYIDPHGDTAERLLSYIPPHRINDVIYFNPSDLEYPIAFNPLESVGNEQKHLVASGLMGVFTKIWANLWSARMEYILNNTVLALLEVPGNSLLGIMRMLVDTGFRKKIVSRVTDPMVRAFWVDEFANYNERFRTEAIAPIQNKVGQFLASSIIRNIVGQPKSSMHLREVMDNKKILIMNLSKGRIGEDASALLGAMMITKLQLAAMSRVDIEESTRKDFYLYVDEFQNFSTESFAEILSEARKYRLDLILAHQYIEQLSDEVRAGVFGNVGTMISFRVGSEDAESLEKEFGPNFMAVDLVNLTKFNIVLKLMIDGVASNPFSAQTLPPMQEGKYFPENQEKVIKVSRERYAAPKAEVEEKIVRWLSPEQAARDAASGAVVDEEEERFDHQKKSESGKKQKEPNAVCDNCTNPVYVSFTPDEKRNVFCKDCLQKFKNGEIDANSLPKRNVKKSAAVAAATPVQSAASEPREAIKPQSIPASEPPEKPASSHHQNIQQHKTTVQTSAPHAPKLSPGAGEKQPLRNKNISHAPQGQRKVTEHKSAHGPKPRQLADNRYVEKGEVAQRHPAPLKVPDERVVDVPPGPGLSLADALQQTPTRFTKSPSVTTHTKHTAPEPKVVKPGEVVTF